MRKLIVIILLLVILLGCAAAYFKFYPKTQPRRPVNLYYYNPELDKDGSGNIMCSRQGLVLVQRKIPVTQTPIQDTIKFLLRGELTNEEREQGISTEYPLEGLSLGGADVKDGILTLQFNDPNNKTGGGSCRVGILWFQIETRPSSLPGFSKSASYRKSYSNLKYV